MNNDLQKFINNPLSIRGKTIPSRLILSSMSGLGHIAYRELLAHYGGYGLMFSEMINAKTVPHENRYKSDVFRWRDEERHCLVWQLLGSDPSSMSNAAKRIEQEGFFGVDLNFSCSVAQICKQKFGAAILKEPNLAQNIVCEIRKSVDIPIFVKFRIGWENRPEDTVDLAKRLQDAGADALIFHPRIAPDLRTRPPKWEYIGLVKNAVEIPVFGNGNVFEIQDCKKIIAISNCDGVALGRIAISKPWIFAEWSGKLLPCTRTFYDAAIRLLELLGKHYAPKAALSKFKKFANYYCANFKYGHTLLAQIKKSSSPDDIVKTLDTFFNNDPIIQPRPNENMFL